MFRTDEFIEECRNALKEANAHSAVQEIVERTVSDPNNMRKAETGRRTNIVSFRRPDDH